MNVIGFSLYGSDEKYTFGAIRNAELAKEIYPDYECWYYVDNTVPEDVLNKLASFDNTKIFMNSSGNKMMWKFRACSDPNVQVFLSRDCDSRVNKREKEAVDAWLNSDKNFHAMRDHPVFHQPLILGGMWGVRNGLLIDMEFHMSNISVEDSYGHDQKFIQEVVWPIVENTTLFHDDYMNISRTIPPYPPAEPFPSRIEPDENGVYDFVGNIYLVEDGQEKPEDHHKEHFEQYKQEVLDQTASVG